MMVGLAYLETPRHSSSNSPPAAFSIVPFGIPLWLYDNVQVCTLCVVCQYFFFLVLNVQTFALAHRLYILGVHCPEAIMTS